MLMSTTAFFSIFDIIGYATFLCDSILDCLCTYFCLSYLCSGLCFELYSQFIAKKKKNYTLELNTPLTYQKNFVFRVGLPKVKLLGINNVYCSVLL